MQPVKKGCMAWQLARCLNACERLQKMHIRLSHTRIHAFVQLYYIYKGCLVVTCNFHACPLADPSTTRNMPMSTVIDRNILRYLTTCPDHRCVALTMEPSSPWKTGGSPTGRTTLRNRCLITRWLDCLRIQTTSWRCWPKMKWGIRSQRENFSSGQVQVIHKFTDLCCLC